MNKRYKLCVVGHGFVGKALTSCINGMYTDSNNWYGIPGDYKVTIVDPAYDTPIETIKGKSFDAIFVSVPTPSNDDGTIDSSIVESVLDYIDAHVNYEIVVIKSTITPNLVDFYCQNPKFVYNPEFLTESKAEHDFRRAPFHVIGSNSKSSGEFLENIYKNMFEFSNEPTYLHVAPAEASFIKYGINSFLATKVAWFNQFYDLVKTFNPDLDFDAITNAMKRDARVGTSHMQVPGWDGRRGFGGACFPKDIPALIHFSKKQNGELTILKSAWNYNVYCRNLADRLEREVAQNIHYDTID